MSVKAYSTRPVKEHFLPFQTDWLASSSFGQTQKLPSLGSNGHIKSLCGSTTRLNHQESTTRSSSTAASTPVAAPFPAVLNNNINVGNNNNNNVQEINGQLRVDAHGRRLPLTPSGESFRQPLLTT